VPTVVNSRFRAAPAPAVVAIEASISLRLVETLPVAVRLTLRRKEEPCPCWTDRLRIWRKSRLH
jgi:hypothetical protein